MNIYTIHIYLNKIKYMRQKNIKSNNTSLLQAGTRNNQRGVFLSLASLHYVSPEQVIKQGTSNVVGDCAENYNNS